MKLDTATNGNTDMVGRSQGEYEERIQQVTTAVFSLFYALLLKL